MKIIRKNNAETKEEIVKQNAETKEEIVKQNAEIVSPKSLLKTGDKVLIDNPYYPEGYVVLELNRIYTNGGENGFHLSEWKNDLSSEHTIWITAIYRGNELIWKRNEPVDVTKAKRRYQSEIDNYDRRIAEITKEKEVVVKKLSNL